MKREDIITDLSDRLCRRGLTASRADLEALASGMRRTLAPVADIDVLAMLFMQAQVTELRRKLVCAWMEALRWAVVGLTLLAVGALFAWVCLLFADGAPVVPLRVVSRIACCVLAAGLTAIAAGVVKAVRQSLAVRRRIRAVCSSELSPADPREQSDGDHDAETQARRFHDWHRRVEGTRDRKRATAWAEGACLAGIGSVIFGIGILGILCPLLDPLLTTSDPLVGAWFLVTGGITALGAAIIVLGLFRSVRTSRRLADGAEAQGDS